MRAKRIKTGFHRIGVVLVVICVIVAAASVYGGGSMAMREATTALVVGGFLYALAFGIGWILAGFAGDGESR